MHYDTSRRVSDTRWLPKDKGIQLLSFVLSPHKIYYVWPVHGSLRADARSHLLVFEKHVRKSYGSFEMIDRSLFISTSIRSPFLEWNLYHHFDSISVRPNPFDTRSFTRPNKGKNFRKTFPLRDSRDSLTLKEFHFAETFFAPEKHKMYIFLVYVSVLTKNKRRDLWFDRVSQWRTAPDYMLHTCIYICIEISASKIVTWTQLSRDFSPGR